MPVTFKAITTKYKIKISALERGILDAAEKTQDIILKEYKAITRTWKHTVTFKVRGPFIRGGRVIGEVTTTDKIYNFVTGGTRAHIIRPRRKFLRFRTGYRSKTSPRVLGSTAGGSFGAFVLSRGVRHPGIKAREFEQEIARRHEPAHIKRVEAAIRKATK